MKIPGMAWITQINYTFLQSSVYCLCFIIQNVYIFCLLSYSDSSADRYVFRYFCDWIYVDFLCEGTLWNGHQVFIVLMAYPSFFGEFFFIL